MANGEAIKTTTAYSALSSHALMDASVHELIMDREDKLYQLASILITDDEVMLVADLIQSAMWYDMKAGIIFARKTANHIVHNWGLLSNETELASLDNDETSSTADFAIQYLRTALHQTHTDWAGKHILPGIRAAANSPYPNIILVDDFIGTGRKALKKIKWIRENEIIRHNIYVATFVGQFRSRYSIGLVSKSYFACHWGWKSISDVYLSDTSRKYLNSMLDIEGRFGTIGKFDTLGNGRSEATFFPVATNTPNNVFPIFWKDKHNLNRKFSPLLVRSPK